MLYVINKKRKTTAPKICMPPQGPFFFSFLLQPSILVAASRDLFFFTLDGSHQISEFTFDQFLVFMSHYFGHAWLLSQFLVFLVLSHMYDSILEVWFTMVGKFGSCSGC